MGRIFEGKLTGDGLKIAIITSRFNSLITEKLYEGAIAALRRHGVPEETTDSVWVPGAFELPVVAQRLAKNGGYDAVICIGAVIRGATAHFDFVAAEAARGVTSAARKTGVPILFGVLTTDTIEQAIERTGAKGSNKGFDVAVAAIEMANLMKVLPG